MVALLSSIQPSAMCSASEDEDSVEFGTFSRLSLKVLFKSKSVKTNPSEKHFEKIKFEIF